MKNEIMKIKIKSLLKIEKKSPRKSKINANVPTFFGIEFNFPFSYLSYNYIFPKCIPSRL